MNRQGGFVWTPLLIVIGLFLAGGIVGDGVYLFLQEDATPQVTEVTEKESHVGEQTATPLTSPYGCYAKTATGVYLDEGIPDATTYTLSNKAQKVVGADVATFREAVPYGICFGVDKNHVYKDTAVLSWADPATFKLLWYSKPGPVLFFRNGSKIVAYTTTRTDVRAGTFSDVPDGDPATFETILGGYDFAPWARDKNQVYCDGVAIRYGQPSTASQSSDGTQLSFDVNGLTRTYTSMCVWVGKNNSLSASPLLGSAPLTVHFTSQPSAGDETLVFGDGKTSNSPEYNCNPKTEGCNVAAQVDHIYTAPGTYIVQLYRHLPSIQIGEVVVTVTQ